MFHDPLQRCLFLPTFEKKEPDGANDIKIIFLEIMFLSDETCQGSNSKTSHTPKCSCGHKSWTARSFSVLPAQLPGSQEKWNPPPPTPVPAATAHPSPVSHQTPMQPPGGLVQPPPPLAAHGGSKRHCSLDLGPGSSTGPAPLRLWLPTICSRSSQPKPVRPTGVLPAHSGPAEPSLAPQPGSPSPCPVSSVILNTF